MSTFQTIEPILSVRDMVESIYFWTNLGFEAMIADDHLADRARYVVMAREGLRVHLQRSVLGTRTQPGSVHLRIVVEHLDALDALYAEWLPLGVISNPLEARPWGAREFGLCSPDGTVFCFTVQHLHPRPYSQELT